MVANVSISKYAVFAKVSLALRLVRFPQSHVQPEQTGGKSNRPDLFYLSKPLGEKCQELTCYSTLSNN